MAYFWVQKKVSKNHFFRKICENGMQKHVFFDPCFGGSGPGKCAKNALFAPPDFGVFSVFDLRLQWTEL